MKRRPSYTTRAACGFSLVEVALSLGIVAVALTAIVGLLSVTVGQTKAITDDTLIADMSGDLLNTLRKQPFDGISSVPVVYYNIDGQRVNPTAADGSVESMPAGSAISAGAVYKCAPRVTSDTNTTRPDPAGGDDITNLWRITLDFSWPVTAAGTPVNRRNIHADIARYQ
ncbi:MAG: type IV pilus modification PilV family protein [Terrimicrobiaceae bacterium]